MISGIAVLAGAWVLAAAGHSITGHMTAHMAAVSMAAPLMAFGLAGTAFDPAVRWPRFVSPVPMMLVELLVVWAWHMPAARALADGNPAGLALEQAMFVSAGMLLWSACLGTRDASSSTRRAAGVIALLLTMMHMTLLGVLVALAPRTLFSSAGFTWFGTSISPLTDQQLGGVVMLLIGAGSYLLGGLALLFRLLRAERWSTARP